MWVVLLWWLLGIVLLLKAPPIRRLVCKLHRQPPAVQATLALCLLIAVITGGTKPGGTNELSSLSQPAIFASDNSSLIIQQSSLLPSWWTHDATDTDEDGIPDLWEKWTHGNRQVADGGIDRDEDGLTDLEEFQSQTDPRTADTDGDGFDDAFEVAHGMDPLVQADFTPVEPDENQNGFIDLWENEPYLYGFTDTNHNGFDDYYEAYCLEPESEDNYDVVVDVCTTRSAALTWTTGALTEGVVLPATTMTSVRLRLPFGEDAQIALLSSPEGTPPPPGGLWKSRLRLSFAPRDGQTAIGTCIVSADDEIQQKVVVAESTISRFPDPPANLSQGLVQTQSLRGDYAGDVPRIEITYRKLGVKPVDPGWHFVDELIGPFSITNYAGALPDDVSWSVDYGEVSVAPGSVVAYLRVTEEPPSYKNGVITLKAASELDAETVVTNRIEVPKCIQPEFSLTDGTGNFSPHLGETASFTLALPGCNHAPREGWLEGELMRETTSGWQHVGWLDASQAEPGHQKRRRCLFGPQTITWDGIATEIAALADSPDVFTEGRAPFHRALPEVVSGEPVPPPYYTIFFRYREADSDTATVIDETSTTVYVPQVVRVLWNSEVVGLFAQPFVYEDGEVVTNMYFGVTQENALSLFRTIPMLMSLAMPSEVNLRVVAEVPVQGQCKEVSIVPTVRHDGTLGLAHNAMAVFPNVTPSGNASIYPYSIRRRVSLSYLFHLLSPEDETCISQLPMQASDYLNHIVRTSIHETGHLLGLVHPYYLGGSQSAHNAVPIPREIMNSGSAGSAKLDIEPLSTITWKTIHVQYLRFILPTPQ